MLFLFIMWPIYTYYGMRLDTLKINPQSDLDNDLATSGRQQVTSGWTFQKLGLGTLELGVTHNVPRNGLPHHCFPDFGGQLAFPWVLQEEGRYTCVVFYVDQRNPAVAGQVPWSASKCQSAERGKTLFLKAFQAAPVQLLGWFFSRRNRIALVGLE